MSAASGPVSGELSPRRTDGIMALPPQLKAIQHHLRTAQEHEKRDPVVAYYCESLRFRAARGASSR